MGSNTYVLPVKPHIRKYLMVRLAPGERLADLDTRDLVHDISRQLRVSVHHAQLDATASSRPSSLLTLVLAAPLVAVPRPLEVKGTNFYLESHYTRHAHTWMDQVGAMLGLSISAVLVNWRARYSITEEDQPFETARRAYARYRERHGRMLPHGGVRRKCEMKLI